MNVYLTIADNRLVSPPNAFKKQQKLSSTDKLGEHEQRELKTFLEQIRSFSQPDQVMPFAWQFHSLLSRKRGNKTQEEEKEQFGESFPVLYQSVKALCDLDEKYHQGEKREKLVRAIKNIQSTFDSDYTDDQTVGCTNNYYALYSDCTFDAFSQKPDKILHASNRVFLTRDHRGEWLGDRWACCNRSSVHDCLEARWSPDSMEYKNPENPDIFLRLEAGRFYLYDCGVVVCQIDKSLSSSPKISNLPQPNRCGVADVWMDGNPDHYVLSINEQSFATLLATNMLCDDKDCKVKKLFQYAQGDGVHSDNANRIFKSMLDHFNRLKSCLEHNDCEHIVQSMTSALNCWYLLRRCEGQSKMFNLISSNDLSFLWRKLMTDAKENRTSEPNTIQAVRALCQRIIDFAANHPRLDPYQQDKKHDKLKAIKDFWEADISVGRAIVVDNLISCLKDDFVRSFFKFSLRSWKVSEQRHFFAQGPQVNFYQYSNLSFPQLLNALTVVIANNRNVDRDKKLSLLEKIQRTNTTVQIRNSAAEHALSIFHASDVNYVKEALEAIRSSEGISKSYDHCACQFCGCVCCVSSNFAARISSTWRLNTPELLSFCTHLFDVSRQSKNYSSSLGILQEKKEHEAVVKLPTDRNEDPNKEPRPENLLQDIIKLERELLLDLKTQMIKFELEPPDLLALSQSPSPSLMFSTFTEFWEFWRRTTQTRQWLIKCNVENSSTVQQPVELAGTGIEKLGITIVLRRERYDGDVSIRLCIDGPKVAMVDDDRMKFTEGNISFSLRGTNFRKALVVKLNTDEIEYYHFLASTINEKKDKGKTAKSRESSPVRDEAKQEIAYKETERGQTLFARVYGHSEVSCDDIRPLFEPEYFKDEASYPALEFQIYFGDVKLCAIIHSFMFDDITDADTQNCLEAHMRHPRNKRQVFTENAISDAKKAALTLKDKHVMSLIQENGAKKALKVTDADGYASAAVHVIEAFKFLLEYHFETVRYHVIFKEYLLCVCFGNETLVFQIDPAFLNLIKVQGMQLERMCAFSSALKYYFAGVQYFNKLDKIRRVHESDAAGKHSDDQDWRELREKFKALYENLIPLTNAEVIPRMVFNKSR